LDIKDVIRLLRGVAETTDNNATYNFDDTFENNEVMKLLKACPSSVTNDIRNVVTGVRRWAKRLRGKGNDHAWSDFMDSKFQHHMEEGSYNRPLSDIKEIGDRVLQWGSHLDKKRVELRQYFPPSQTSNNPSTSTYGPTSNKGNATGKSSQRPQATRDPFKNDHIQYHPC
jgi:hypothetical protein